MVKRVAFKKQSTTAVGVRKRGVAGIGRGVYRPEFSKEVERLCKLGTTDRDLALYFNVSVITIGNWKDRYPEFFEAVSRGKQQADTRVACAMYKSAMGFYYDEEVLVKKWNKTFNKDGTVKTAYEVIERVMVSKYCKPDTTAQIFFLKNRRPDQWRDVKFRPDENPDNSEKMNTPEKILAEMKKRGIVMIEDATYSVVEKNGRAPSVR